MRILAVVIILTVCPIPALADDFFSEPCVRAGIPRNLAVAIARQESSLHPWAINVQGKAIMPDSREEAVSVIRSAQRAGKSFDVGLMQINSQWPKKWRIDPVTLLDPETNIRLGLLILGQEIKRHGFNWLAVGKYHTPNPERGRQYAWRVFRHLKGGSLETLFTQGKKEGNGLFSESNSSGIWRNPEQVQKGRIITFRVWEESVYRLPRGEPRGSAGTERTPESKR